MFVLACQGNDFVRFSSLPLQTKTNELIINRTQNEYKRTKSHKRTYINLTLPIKLNNSQQA